MRTCIVALRRGRRQVWSVVQYGLANDNALSLAAWVQASADWHPSSAEGELCAFAPSRVSCLRHNIGHCVTIRIGGGLQAYRRMLDSAWRTSHRLHLFRLTTVLAVIHCGRIIAGGTSVYDLSPGTTLVKSGNHLTHGAGLAAAVRPERRTRWHDEMSYDEGNALKLSTSKAAPLTLEKYAIAAASPAVSDPASSNPRPGTQPPAVSAPGPSKSAGAPAGAPSFKPAETASRPLHVGPLTGMVEELTSLNSSEAAITSLIWQSVKSRVQSTELLAERLTMADGGPLPQHVMPDPSVANEVPAARIEVTPKSCLS